MEKELELNEVLNLIKQGKLKDALERAVEYSKLDGDRTVAQRIMTLSSHFHRLRKKELAGMRVKSKEFNEITFSLITTIEDLNSKKNSHKIKVLKKDNQALKSEISRLKNEINSLEKTEGKLQGEESLDIGWDEYWEAVKELAKILDRDTIVKGFRPQLLVGISRGGMVTTDLLSRILRNVPVISLWADRDSSHNPGVVDFFPPANPYNNQDLAEIIQIKKIKRILLVDDFMKIGASMKGAFEFIDFQLQKLPTEVYKDIRIKTAVIAQEEAFSIQRIFDVDYFIFKNKKNLPYGRG